MLALVLSLCVAVEGGAAAAPGAVTALAFSPDGKRLAVGSYKQVAIYDTGTWQVASSLHDVQDAVRSLAYHPDGHTLAVGSGLPGRSGVVAIWDTAASAPPRILPAQQDTVEAVAYGDNGAALLLGSNDHKACIYGALPSPDHTILDEHNDRVDAVAFSARPDYIFLTGSMDKIVKVWDAKTRKVVVNFDQSEAGVTGLVALPGGSQFVGSSLDGRLYWWNVYFNEKKHDFGGNRYRTEDAHPGGVLALGISADGKRLVTGGEDSTAAVWDAQSGRRLQTFKDAAQPIYAVALSPDGKLAAAAGREGVVRIYDVDANKLLTTLTPPALPAGNSARTK